MKKNKSVKKGRLPKYKLLLSCSNLPVIPLGPQRFRFEKALLLFGLGTNDKPTFVKMAERIF